MQISNDFQEKVVTFSEVLRYLHQFTLNIKASWLREISVTQNIVRFTNRRNAAACRQHSFNKKRDLLFGHFFHAGNL